MTTKTTIEEKARIAEDYKGKIEKFRKDAKSRIYKEAETKTLQHILSFLKAETNDVPLIKKGDDYYFRDIISILNPYNQWTFLDRRIVAYITQDKKEFLKGFYKQWLQQEIEQRKMMTPYFLTSRKN